MRGRLGLIISLILFSTTSFAWQIKPEGKFHVDSARVGDEILYSLSVTYPVDQDVVFPDSLYNFSPFELNQKDYFFTRSDDKFSFDSAVYNLSTFEIDSIQILSIPIWVVKGSDSTVYYPTPDSIILNHVVTQIPDSVALIDNTIYKEVNYAFNYPYLIIGVIITLVILSLAWYFYGKNMLRQYRLYMLGRMHKKFIKTYNELIHSQRHDWEKSLLEWKIYMEALDDAPYTKLTTKEIARKTKDNLLLNALKGIDRAIYGKGKKESDSKYFEDLVSFARSAYASKVKKIKYGTDARKYCMVLCPLV